MIKINMPIIVEGKYDKINIENTVDALIIPTNGFSIFKDKQKCELIRMFAERDGIIVLTDSDSAGNMIRSYIKNIVAGGKIINVYVPQLKGKEKRKSVPSKEGYLGVEGIPREILKEAFEKSGVTGKECEKGKKITKIDMFEYGLSGSENSAQNRKNFLKFLKLPENLSSNAMLDILNTIFCYEEFQEAVKKCLSRQNKS